MKHEGAKVDSVVKHEGAKVGSVVKHEDVEVDSVVKHEDVNVGSVVEHEDVKAGCVVEHEDVNAYSLALFNASSGVIDCEFIGPETVAISPHEWCHKNSRHGCQNQRPKVRSSETACILLYAVQQNVARR